MPTTSRKDPRVRLVYPRLMTYLLAGILVYVAICALAWAFQSRLIYFPDDSVLGNPSDRGLEYRDAWLDSDGVRLHAWYLPGEPGRPVLLFCHGNAGNLTGRLESLEIFRGLGLSVLIFDYRGYGRSMGRPSEAGTYADVTAAWRYLTVDEGFAPEEVVVFGRSLGGAVAVDLASRVQPGGLILESTFSSAVDLGRRVYPWLPVSLIARHRYDSAKRIPSVGCPKLFIHSPQDEIIPYDLGRKLYDLAPPPRSFLDIRGGHNEGFLVSLDIYVSGLAAFLDSIR